MYLVARPGLSTHGPLTSASSVPVALRGAQVDPSLSRTVVVSTKLDTRIPQFARPHDVEMYLRPPSRLLEPTMLGGSPFFTCAVGPCALAGTAGAIEQAGCACSRQPAAGCQQQGLLGTCVAPATMTVLWQHSSQHGTPHASVTTQVAVPLDVVPASCLAFKRSLRVRMPRSVQLCSLLVAALCPLAAWATARTPSSAPTSTSGRQWPIGRPRWVPQRRAG